MTPILFDVLFIILDREQTNKKKKHAGHRFIFPSDSGNLDLDWYQYKKKFNTDMLPSFIFQITSIRPDFSIIHWHLNEWLGINWLLDSDAEQILNKKLKQSKCKTLLICRVSLLAVSILFATLCVSIKLLKTTQSEFFRPKTHKELLYGNVVMCLFYFNKRQQKWIRWKKLIKPLKSTFSNNSETINFLNTVVSDY